MEFHSRRKYKYINILKSLKICVSVQIKIKEHMKKWPATGAKDWKRELKKSCLKRFSLFFFVRLCSHWFPYTFENIIGQENNENLAVEGLKLPIFVSSHDLSPSVTEFQLKF